MNRCRVCGSNEIKLLKEFKPYSDKEWKYEIFDCIDCGARMAFNENISNQHEILYKNYYLYDAYYYLGNVIRKLLQKQKLNDCRYLLCNIPSYREIIHAIEKSGTKVASLLEIGCSTGFLTSYFHACGHDAFGIDISETAIEAAKKNFGNFFGFIPHKSDYDFIFFTGTIGCIENPKSFIDKFLTYLAPGGVMIFNSPNMRALPGNRIWVSTPPPDLINIYTEKSFKKIINSSKFDVKMYELGELKIKTNSEPYPMQFNKKPIASYHTKYRSPVFLRLYNLVKYAYLMYQKLIFKAQVKKSEYGLIVSITEK